MSVSSSSSSGSSGSLGPPGPWSGSLGRRVLAWSCTLVVLLNVSVLGASIGFYASSCAAAVISGGRIRRLLGESDPPSANNEQGPNTCYLCDWGCKRSACCNWSSGWDDICISCWGPYGNCDKCKRGFRVKYVAYNETRCVRRAFCK